MRLADANVLLYAVNADSEHHEAARTWLDRGLAGGDTVGLTWPALTAFLRLATKVSLFPRPLEPQDALDQVRVWLDAAAAQLVQPTPRHLDVLDRLIRASGSGGNLVADAHLGAIAIEHRAEVVTYDGDFARFPGVRWQRPDDLV